MVTNSTETEQENGDSGVTGGGVEPPNPSPREIPKALQNRAKINPIVKTVKYC